MEATCCEFAKLLGVLCLHLVSIGLLATLLELVDHALNVSIEAF